jgi:hypothetical protein
MTISRESDVTPHRPKPWSVSRAPFPGHHTVMPEAPGSSSLHRQPIHVTIQPPTVFHITPFHDSRLFANGEPRSTSNRSIVSIDPYLECISLCFCWSCCCCSRPGVLSLSFSGVIKSIIVEAVEVELPKLGRDGNDIPSETRLRSCSFSCSSL